MCLCEYIPYMWVPEVARGAVRFTAARVTGACELLGMGVLCDLDQQVCLQLHGPERGSGDQKMSEGIEKLGIRRPCISYVLCQESLLRTASYMLFCRGKWDRVSKKNIKLWDGSQREAN